MDRDILDARICLCCKEKAENKRNLVAHIRMSPNGFVERIRKCKNCGLTYKTYELHEKDFEKYLQIEKAIREIVRKEETDK